MIADVTVAILTAVSVLVVEAADITPKQSMKTNRNKIFKELAKYITLCKLFYLLNKTKAIN